MPGEAAPSAALAATDTTAAPATKDKEHSDPGQSATTSVAPSAAAQAEPSISNGAPPAAAPPAKPKPVKKPKPKPKVADAAKANSLAGGLIGTPSIDPPPPGWLLAGGGTRKSLPELVVPFKLPCFTLGDAPPKPAAEDGASSQEDSDIEGESETSSDGASDSDESSGTKAERKQQERERKLARRALEQTYLQTQSLRQSRLFYLASLLQPYSQRAPRSGQVFPASIPPSCLHGIDPSAKGSHVLVSLGRFDVQAGPHIFAKSKLWEMRKEAPPSSPKSSRKTSAKQGSPTPSRPKAAASAAKAKALPKATQTPATTSVPENPSSSNVPAAAAKRTPKAKQAASKKNAAAAASSPGGSSAQPAQGTPENAATGTPKDPIAPQPAQRALPSSSSPAPQRAPQPPPAPPVAAPSTVDPVLVTRVNMRATHNPALRDLLGVAARGQASPEQLRALGEVIQSVTREMEAEGLVVQPPRPLPQPQPPVPRPTAASPPQPAPGPSGAPATPFTQGASSSDASKAKPDGTPTLAPKKPRKSGGPKKKKKQTAGTAEKGPDTADKAADAASGATAGSSEAPKTPQREPAPKAAEPAAKPTTAAPPKKSTASSAKGQQSKSAGTTAAPAPCPAPAPLFRPPILVLEFRENFATRFYLPVWSSIVTRQKYKQLQPEEECAEEELTEEVPIRPMIEIVEIRLQFLAPLQGSDAASGVSAGTKIPVCLVVSGQDPQGMLWEAASRVPGVKTLDEHGQVIPHEPAIVQETDKGALPLAKQGSVDGAEPKPSEDGQAASSADDQTLQKADEERRQKEEAERKAKEQKAQAELQQERESLRAIAEAILARPEPTIMDASGPFPPGLADHLADRFAPAGPAATQADAPRGARATAPKRRKSRTEKDAFTIATSNAEESIDLSMYAMDSDGEQSMSMSVSAGAGRAKGAGKGKGATTATTTPTPTPRKKRNVATHNPDGTLKRCGYCHTNSTPMWRRGPDGAGTLCNACGARWKVGRLEAIPAPVPVPEAKPPVPVGGAEDATATGQAGAGAGAGAEGEKPSGESAKQADAQDGAAHEHTRGGGEGEAADVDVDVEMRDTEQQIG